MKPFTKIIVPVDFSPHSDAAIRIAADLSRKYEASVTLVHVYEPVAYALPEGYVLYTADQLASLLSTFEQRLAAAREIAQREGTISPDTKLLQGSAGSEIVDYAQKNGFDLIVMGTHGRTGLKHALMGSVAEKVLRRAHCPVLTVRASEER
jgi:nucleotide-binding universal stress UspA family protein